MNLESFAYSLPSTKSFLNAIAGDGVGVRIVLLPDNLSREMSGRLVREQWSTRGTTVSRLSNPGDQNPVLASAKSMSAIWPSPQTLRTAENLLRCAGLPEVLYVHRVGPQPEWKDFIEGWGRAHYELRNSGSAAPPTLCVLAKLRDFDFVLPEPGPGLTFHWWWGFPSALEVRLACRMASNQFEEDDPALAGWREYVLPGLVGGDVQLAERMWDRLGDAVQTIEGLAEFRDGLEHESFAGSIDEAVATIAAHQGTYAAGQAVPEGLRRLWADGGLTYSTEYGLEVHPAWLAHCERWEDVRDRLWRGQSELILPFVNRIRLRVCQDLTKTYGEDWPERWITPKYYEEDTEDSHSPLGTELSHLTQVLGLGKHIPGHELSQKRSLADLAQRANGLRNKIAHYHPISCEEYVDLHRAWDRADI